MLILSVFADRQTKATSRTIAYMLESMKYIGLEDTYVAFVTPSMSHAELRAALALEAVDAGFISFRQQQHIKVWGDSVSLRLGHSTKHNGIVPVWHAIYWDNPYPHVVMTPNKELQLRMAQALTERFSWMEQPIELHLSDVTPKILDCTDDYGSTRNYGPWNGAWDPMLTRAMYQTDWGTKVRVMAEDLPPV